MRIRHFMTGLLEAAIALIVVLAVPSLAHAHAGHHHPPATAKAIAKAQPVDAASSAAPADSAPAPVRFLSLPTDRDATPPCGAVTCCSKACSACCVALSGSAPIVEPLWTRVRTAPPDLHVPAAAGLDDLSRPPKSLARI